jgi:prepilin-type N-terminal cleavage/methylation domain-containing protein
MRRARRGMSLMEVMVVMAIMLLLLAVLAPATRSLFQLQQREGAKKLSAMYERLHDEAIMRNYSFRITYYLDEDKYEITPGQPGALISAGPAERARYAEEVKSKLRFMSEEEKVAYQRSSDQPFDALEAGGTMTIELPSGVSFGGVYTPQYGRIVKPGETLEENEQEEGDEKESLKVYSYVMNTGFSEHTLVWLVSTGNPDDGWTIEVEPLSGAVKMHGELIDPADFDWIPTEGPKLP